MKKKRSADCSSFYIAPNYQNFQSHTPFTVTQHPAPVNASLNNRSPLPNTPRHSPNPLRKYPSQYTPPYPYYDNMEMASPTPSSCSIASSSSLFSNSSENNGDFSNIN